MGCLLYKRRLNENDKHIVKPHPKSILPPQLSNEKISPKDNSELVFRCLIIRFM